MDAKSHWEGIYQTKQSNEVSWTQTQPALAQELVMRYAPHTNASIWDVGGGESNLVDALLDCGYSNVTVLDIAASALQRAQARLGNKSALVNWVVADITQMQPVPNHTVDVWHDRAVFHFLTHSAERAAYVQAVHNAVKVGGHVVIATFALDGPSR